MGRKMQLHIFQCLLVGESEINIIKKFSAKLCTICETKNFWGVCGHGLRRVWVDGVRHG